MAKTYRDVAIDQMIATVEEAMSRAIDWWGNLPTPMNEAIDKFRVQLGAAIDSVEFVKKERSTGEYRNRQRRPLNSDEDWLQDSTQNGDNNRVLLI